MFIFRQARAAALGYAVMGIFELRSRDWQEIRWFLVMADIWWPIATVVACYGGGPGRDNCDPDGLAQTRPVAVFFIVDV